MATPGTTTYPKKRRNLMIGKHTWPLITRRAAEMAIPPGEVIDVLVTSSTWARRYDTEAKS